MKSASIISNVVRAVDSELVNTSQKCIEQRRYTSQNTLYVSSLVQLSPGIGHVRLTRMRTKNRHMQEGSRWLSRQPLDVVREEAIRRGEGGSHLGVVREVAIRRGEKCCFTQGGEED